MERRFCSLVRPQYICLYWTACAEGRSLALLGEADLLVAGQPFCPRSPPDIIASFAGAHVPEEEEWVVEGVCAYVPQVSSVPDSCACIYLDSFFPT